MMTDEITNLQARVKVLEEALNLADAALAGANMNMNVVERKIKAALAACQPADPVTNASCCQPAAMQMMETAPKDGSVILVWYDHDADPYQDPDNPDLLTDYAVWCEGGDFMKGRGYCLACWEPPFFESTDEYGSGFWLPAWWFKEDENERVAVNPIRWMPLPLNDLTTLTSETGCRQPARVRHVKRGSTYRVVGAGKVQTGTPLHDYDEVVIYQGEEDGLMWVRPTAEFGDGRFEPLEPAPVTLAGAAKDVLAERQRQISAEGWTPEHDDAHINGEMAQAAACYTLNAAGWLTEALRGCWPTTWACAWFKPTDPRRDLVKAGALIIAEIERLDRAALRAIEETTK